MLPATSVPVSLVGLGWGATSQTAQVPQWTVTAEGDVTIHLILHAVSTARQAGWGKPVMNPAYMAPRCLPTVGSASVMHAIPGKAVTGSVQDMVCVQLMGRPVYVMRHTEAANVRSGAALAQTMTALYTAPVTVPHRPVSVYLVRLWNFYT